MDEPRIPPLDPEVRDELDEVARWRRTDAGWIICDPSLDEAIADLNPVARRLLADGVNLTCEQAEALSPRADENA